MTDDQWTPDTPQPVEDILAELVPSDRMPLIHRVPRDLSDVDHAVYQAVAATPTPTLDEPIRRLSNAANRSVIWVVAAAVLAGAGGQRGRRAALGGLTSIVVSSAVVNVATQESLRQGAPGPGDRWRRWITPYPDA